MRRHLTLLVPLTLIAVLAAACGNGAQQTGEPSTAAGASPAAQSGAMRTIEHAMGATQVPDNPERVVVLDTGELDSAIALGVVPVGAVRAPVEDGFLDYLQDETATAGTELVGTIEEPNLEAIARLNPDLILSSVLRHEDLYDELSAIAPTVFTETVGVVWKENLQVHAEALDRSVEGERLLADYEQRASALGAALREAHGDPPTISVVRFLPDSIRLYQKASFIGTVLEDVGLPRPPAQDVDDFAAEISLEHIPDMDGDVIFTTVYGPAEDTQQQEATDLSLWQDLDAVRQGAVHSVPDDYWMLGIGVGAANLVLDDLETTLLELSAG